MAGRDRPGTVAGRGRGIPQDASCIEQPPGLSRGTLTRANVSKFPALYAYGTINESGASIVGLWSAEGGEKARYRTRGGEDVDAAWWCGATGRAESWDPLSAGVLQLCTWQPDG